MGLVEEVAGGEVSSHPYGAMTKAQAAALANEPWAAAHREVCRVALPAPAQEPA